MRRLTKREKVAEVISKLDAFPKTIDDAKETSSSGGAATVAAVLLIFLLVGSEVMYYRNTDVEYKYEVDHEFRRDMKMWVDITVAMKCAYISADYIDVSGNTSTKVTRGIIMESSYFSLAPNQQEWLDEQERMKESMGSRGLDSLQRFLHSDHSATVMPKATSTPEGEHDACRIHGSIPIAKVAANFHILAGKSIHHARGVAHLAHMVPPHEVNFSHRIDRLSFADEEAGGHTLDGERKVTESRHAKFQYFLKVVPTSTHAIGQDLPFWSNQYSVTEHQTEEHSVLGSRGLPGIYFKYDLEPLTVRVVEVRRSFLRFLVRLCGIIGGIFATSGMLHQTISNMVISVRGVQPSNLPSKSPVT